jgi:hypothetical protein
MLLLTELLLAAPASARRFWVTPCRVLASTASTSSSRRSTPTWLALRTRSSTRPSSTSLVPPLLKSSVRGFLFTTPLSNCHMDNHIDVLFLFCLNSRRRPRPHGGCQGPDADYYSPLRQGHICGHIQVRCAGGHRWFLQVSPVALGSPDSLHHGQFPLKRGGESGS